MGDATWRWTADYIQACNCDWGCPCNWNAPPTAGYCHGFGAYRIRSGQYDGVQLDGLHAAFAVKFPGQVHEGNGIGALYVDERADARQRDALVRTMRGEAGGLPFQILGVVVDRWSPPLFVPFDFKVAGPHSSVTVGEIAKAVLTPIKSPVMGNPVGGTIVLDHGFVFKEATITSLDVFTVLDREVKYAHPGKSGHYAVVDYPY